VIRVGDKHYVPLSEFDPQAVEDAFKTSFELARKLTAADMNVRYLTINGNYLGPAGASIAHPHFQVVGGDIPVTYLEKIMDLAGAYHEKYGSCYWSDLVGLEKERGERSIGATGSVEWLASFSPCGTNEVIGVLPERSHFLELDGNDLSGMAEGIVKVLRGYGDMGISTFNFSVYSGLLGERDDSFCCFIRIISRQNVYENYRTDDYFLQKLLDNELILTSPEALAKNLQPCFE
jgi:galactose-1-phosphate uridylyltransferase